MSFEDLIGVKLPIIQAPMAGVQDLSLALAVSRAGGLGSLPCASLSMEQIETHLETIKHSTDKPINLNFFCHQAPGKNLSAERKWLNLLTPYFEELNVDPESIAQQPSRASFSHDIVDILEPHKPEVISFHFGLPPLDCLVRVKEWGTKILSSATTVDEAVWLQDNGIDLIIAQGVEAGGHRGMFLSQNLESQSGTTTLLHKIREKVTLPVIAAGGISTSKEVTKQLDNGVIATQIGTAYLLCHETKTSLLHREAIRANKIPQTALTNLFSGRPARGIINRVMNELGPINNNAPEFPTASIALSALRNIAEKNGSSDFSPLWCGKNTKGCAEISAYDLTRKLASKL